MSDPVARVLLFGTQFPPSAAGTAIYTRCLALALKDQGVDVAVLTQAQASNSTDEEELPLPVTRIPYTRNVARRYARSLGSLRAHLDHFHPDCLWTTNGMGTRVAGLVGELPCPLITSVRGSDIRTRLPARGPWRRLEGAIQRRAYRRSAGIAAACRDLRTYAIRQGVDERRLFVSHSAFDLARLDSLSASLEKFDREPSTLLTVTRLTRQKRVDVLLRAVAIALRDVPDLNLVVVGDGPERAGLEKLAQQLQISRRVRFAGPLQPFSVELFSEYRRATAFALTSVGEGLANVFIESAAFGLPSLGSDSGGTPEVVTDGVTGWLVQPDDPQDTAARIVALMGDAEARQQMGRAARTWVEGEFGLQMLGERSLAVIRAVVAGDHLPPDRVAS